MNIEILIYDGFDELDALAPYEILAHAVKLGADAKVSLTAFGGERLVTASHGLTVLAQRAPDRPDVIVVPGGGWNDRAAEGAYTQAMRGDIAAFLVDRHAAGSILASVCTGGMLLAHAGLLAGRPATTHHAAIAELAETGAVPAEGRVVDDGNIVTAGGVTSGLDLALHLVARLWGEPLADQVADEIEYERRGFESARAA